MADFIPYAELTPEQKTLVENENEMERKFAAEEGLGLDVLKDDSDWNVRKAVVDQGYALDELKDDPNEYVRRAVARQGYALDELKTDKDLFVRREVARQGYALDELKYDSREEVRAAVAEQGYALDELKDDPKPWVRGAVACQGYALNQLKNDPEPDVRAAVADQGYALDELKDDSDWFVRAEVARQGYALDELKGDPDFSVRAAVAEQGYALDELKNDPNEYVREAVADQGYALDQLINDTAEIVQDKARICLYVEYDYNKIEEWIADNPDKCGLPENRTNQQAPSQLEKPSMPAPEQFRWSEGAYRATSETAGKDSSLTLEISIERLGEAGDYLVNGKLDKNVVGTKDAASIWATSNYREIASTPEQAYEMACAWAEKQHGISKPQNIDPASFKRFESVPKPEAATQAAPAKSVEVTIPERKPPVVERVTMTKDIAYARNGRQAQSENISHEIERGKVI